MKKLMFAAMMLLGTSAAFAGDSEPLKAILKATSYEQAASLVQNSLSQLANNAEKAKAYDKLYELAMTKVNAEQTVQLENQTAKQMGKEGNKPVDEDGLYKALDQALDAAAEVNKYDNMPNAKGKIKPRYASIIDPTYNLRGQLINAGIFFQGKKDDANAYKYLARYVDTAEWPMFASFDKAKDKNLNEIAYYSAIYAYQNKEYAKAEKYIAYAIQSPERVKDAKQVQLAILGSQLKTREDSVAYAQKLSTMYESDPTNEAILTSLTSTYNALGMKDKSEKILNAALEKNPKSYSALIMKGQLALQDRKYDEAAGFLEKALPIATENNQRVALNASIGQCWFYKAQDRVAQVKGILTPAAKAQFNEVYNKAISYLEKAKSLDTAKEQKNTWAYPLYGCYYFVKGAKAPETVAAEADIH